MKGLPHTPVILHAHIPKTAGISLSDRFRRSFDTLHFHHYHPDPQFILNVEDLQTLIRISPWLQSITSHNLRTFPVRLGPRQACYITLLRRPSDCVVSLVAFIKRNFRVLSFEVQRDWPRNTPDLSLRDLTEYYLDQAQGAEQSPQTRFLCNPVTMAAHGLGDRSEYGVNSYPVARLILQRFFFVGIVDEMGKSLEVLSGKLKQVELELWMGWMPRLNVTKKKGRLPWLNEEDAVGRRLLTANQSDERLYAEFRQKLDAAYRNLNAFKKTNSESVGESEEDLGELSIDEWAAYRVASGNQQDPAALQATLSC